MIVTYKYTYTHNNNKADFFYFVVSRKSLVVELMHATPTNTHAYVHKQAHTRTIAPRAVGLLVPCSQIKVTFKYDKQTIEKQAKLVPQPQPTKKNTHTYVHGLIHQPLV